MDVKTVHQYAFAGNVHFQTNDLTTIFGLVVNMTFDLLSSTSNVPNCI